MGSLLYLQSGGPTAVINSSLNGVIRRCRDRGIEVFGAFHGIEGLISNDLVRLTDLPYNRLCLLRQTPGMALGTSRKRIEGDFPFWKEVEQTLIDIDCDYLLINGGNDSMDTAEKLHEHFASWGLKVVGIPKTIDNDLLGTDFCPGYPSACRYVMNAFASIKLDGASYTKGKVNLVEIQGREAGWVAASAGLLKGNLAPDILLLPEFPFDLEGFLAQIQKIYQEKGTVFVALSEGIEVPHDTLSGVDSFGHPDNEGVANALGSIVRKTLHLPVRASVLGTVCRSNPYTISKVDSDQAQWLGEAAVDEALAGHAGIMVGLRRSREKNLHFSLETYPLHECANRERLFPKEWVKDGFPTKEFAAYLLPLLRGDLPVKTDINGVFLACDIEKARR